MGVTSLLIFLFACWIYISFRSADMALYSWLHIDYSNAFFNWLRMEDIHLPNWMVYNAPDGLRTIVGKQAGRNGFTRSDAEKLPYLFHQQRQTIDKQQHQVQLE